MYCREMFKNRFCIHKTVKHGEVCFRVRGWVRGVVGGELRIRGGVRARGGVKGRVGREVGMRLCIR